MAGDTVGRAVLEITADLSGVTRGLNDLNKHAAETGKQLQGMGTGLNLLVIKEFGDIAVRAIKGVADAVIDLGVRGAAVADVRESFAGLSAGVKETSGVMLDSLRRGVMGTVSDFDLMLAANKALGSGLKLTAGDMGTLAAGAKMLADRTGKDTKEAFDALTKAMITGRTKGLAEFGLGIKDGNALLGELTAQLKQAGPSAEDFADYVDRAKVAVNNLRDTAGLVIARVLPDLLAQFKNVSLGSTSFGDSLKFTVNVLANGLVNAAGIGVNAITGLVQVLQSAATMIKSQAAQMWGVLSGKVGVKEALQNIFAVTKLGLDSIRDGIQKAISPTLQWRDYLADVGKVSTVVANQHKGAADKIKKINLDVLLSHKELADAMASIVRSEAAAEAAAAAAISFTWKAAYDKMKSDVMAWSVQTQDMAAKAGFKSREELQATADTAAETYQRMKDSGLYTDAELQKSTEESERAKREAKGETAKYEMTTNQAIAAGAVSVFGMLGEKFKAAAIAGAIINTFQAVAKANAAAPPPMNIVLMAIAAAAGALQVAKIKSSKAGFAEGTSGLDYQNFGSVSPGLLHGEEAIVPRGKAHLLAAEIAAALPKAGAGERGGAASLKKLDRIASGIDRLPSMMKRAFRDGLLLARA